MLLRNGGSAHLVPFIQPPIAESAQTFLDPPPPPQLPMRQGPTQPLGAGHLPLGLGSVAGSGRARARQRVRARASRQHHGQLRAPRRRGGRASGHPRAVPAAAPPRSGGRGREDAAAADLRRSARGLSRHHPEPLVLLALFLFLSLALSLCPLNRSHNAVGFASLKPSESPVWGVQHPRRLQVWVPHPPASRRSRAR